MIKVGLLPSTQWGNTFHGTSEAAMCQDIARKLKPMLDPSFEVMIFAGSTDANTDGAHSLVNWGADYALSLHLDYAGGSEAALCCYQEESSLEYCGGILNTYCQQMGVHNKGFMKRTPGVNGVAVIRIPEASGIPACLIEMGDMQDPDGANWIDESHRAKAARAMAAAVASTLGGVVPPVKEDEMAIFGSGIAVEDWSATFNVSIDGDVWVKVFNPSSKAANVRVGVTISDESRDFTLKESQINILSAKSMGARDDTQIFVHASRPVIVTFKQ
jgi:hypothetical protein